MNAPAAARPSDELLRRYRNLIAKYESVTCALSDCMGRFGAMSASLRPIFEPVSFAGTAVTARTLASDLAAPFKAIDVSQPGDIIVIDAHTSASTAFWGENMTLSAINRGVVAAVIDGACRDVPEIRRLRFPVVCRGIVPNVAAVAGYGEVNVPVQCGGIPVSPGDIVVGDDNGVVVVPLARCEKIIGEAEKLLATEHVLQERLRAGGTIGQLIDVDSVFANTFAYQRRAVDDGG
jgi:regulator of RNase E activity RraA